MIELKAKIKSLTKNILTNKVELTLELDGCVADFNDLYEKPLRVSLKIWREKRSNDANSYFWVLCNKLAYKMQKSPIELYKSYIKEIPNNWYYMTIDSDKAERACKDWESHGLGWIAALKKCTKTKRKSDFIKVQAYTTQFKWEC